MAQTTLTTTAILIFIIAAATRIPPAATKFIHSLLPLIQVPIRPATISLGSRGFTGTRAVRLSDSPPWLMIWL